MSTIADRSTAEVVSSTAHGTRNLLATLRAAADLLDDEEAAADARAAAQRLAQHLERLIVRARIELGTPPPATTLSLDQLVASGIRRARREGTVAVGAPVLSSDVCEHDTDGPMPWLERLVADMLHVSARESEPARLDAATLIVRASPDARAEDIHWIAELAAAVGAGFEQRGDAIAVSFPRPPAARA